MKAVQQNVFNLNKSGEKSLAYVLRPSRYSTIDAKQIVEYCAENSMVPKAYIAGAMTALAQCITNFLLNGHHVEFPSLGVFSLTSSGYAEGDVDKAGLEQLKKLNVRFLPCKDLKTLVENVNVELDGVFDIAGETVLVEDEEGNPLKTQKFYKRVTRTVRVGAEDEEGGSGTGGGTDNAPIDGLYQLTLMSADEDAGSVNSKRNGLYSPGSRIDASATPASGYEFDHWSDGNTEASRTLEMNRHYHLVAFFREA